MQTTEVIQETPEQKEIMELKRVMTEQYNVFQLAKEKISQMEGELGVLSREKDGYKTEVITLKDRLSRATTRYEVAEAKCEAHMEVIEKLIYELKSR